METCHAHGHMHQRLHLGTNSSSVAHRDRFLVRPARASDLPDILQIYNDAVLRDSCTFEEVPWDSPAADAWFRSFVGRFPIFVAAYENEVIGFCAYNEFRRKSGYAITRESSIYVASHAQYGGVGTALYRNLIARAQSENVANLVAVITSSNLASQAFHRRFGFERVGVLPRVGQKNQRRLDAEFWHLALED
jgi:phosphinothricin acetyltransferase